VTPTITIDTPHPNNYPLEIQRFILQRVSGLQMVVDKIKLQNISLYIKAGYPITAVYPHTHPDPLKAGKAPSLNDWQKRTTKSKILKRDFKNAEAGAVLQDIHLIIDIDPRNGGEESLEKLNKELGEDLDKLCLVKVLSGRGDGGRHLYFTKPANKKTRTTLKEYVGLDFKTKGGQVVIPGSIHAATGKRYEFTVDSFELEEITPAPHKLLKILRKSSTELATIKGDDLPDEHLDKKSNAKRARDYLKQQDPPEAGARNNQIYAVAGRVKDFGISPELNAALVDKFYNQRAEDPLDLDELQSAVAHVHRYGQEPVGASTGQQQFQDLDIPEAKLEGKDLEEQEKDVADGWRNLLNMTKASGEDGTQFPYANDLPNAILFTKFHDRVGNGKIAFNMFTKTIMVREMLPHMEYQNDIDYWPESGQSLRDMDVTAIRSYLQQSEFFKCSQGMLDEAIAVSSRFHSYHPVRDYFNSLEWDKKPRLDKWLPTYTGSEDSPYIRAVGRKTLVAAVTRIFKPGTKFDHILILEGDQGIGKSQIIKTLSGEWYSDAHIDVHNLKDAAMLMEGVLLYELGEMAPATKSESETLKAFITREDDKVRRPYARIPESSLRQCTFIGTSNADEYLKDETGNRRYWPVDCQGPFKLDKAKEDRDQIWAEAVHVFRNGHEPLYLETKKLREDAEGQQRERMLIDELQFRIESWLDGEHEFGKLETKDKTYGEEIWVNCLERPKESFEIPQQRRIGKIMKHLGWKRQSVRLGKHHVIKGYRRK